MWMVPFSSARGVAHWIGLGQIARTACIDRLINRDLAREDDGAVRCPRCEERISEAGSRVVTPAAGGL